VLPANVRLDWKVIARYKQPFCLFGLVSDEGKKFYNIEGLLPAFFFLLWIFYFDGFSDGADVTILFRRPESSFGNGTLPLGIITLSMTFSKNVPY
jgi:hypothetical protein